MARLETLKKKLIAAGFTVKNITLRSGEHTYPALSVDTNYDGPYPTTETLRQHREIEKICGKHFDTESRGYRTAVFITERAL